MASNTLNVSQPVYVGVSGVFYGIALITASVRTVIRFRTRQLQILDDFLLLFACMCLTVTTTLLVKMLPYITVLAKMFSATPDLEQVEFRIELDRELKALDHSSQAYLYTHSVLAWVALFSIKFCYLHFMKGLVSRLKGITVYWNIVLGVNVLSLAFNISSLFIGCPYFGKTAIKCLTPHFSMRVWIILATATSLDIMTDLLSLLHGNDIYHQMLKWTVIVIPIYLVSKVKMQFRQKFGIAFFLCLSILMIVVAIVRICGVHTAAATIWTAFWVHIEQCVAVIAVSSTAFRTFYVSSHRKASENNQAGPYHEVPPIKLTRKKLSSQTGLSQTLTEVPTHVRGSQYDSTSGSRSEDEANGDTIHVLHENNTDIEKHMLVHSAEKPS